MELKEIRPGELVNVQPLPETHPEVEVTVERLTQAEIHEIWTKCGIKTDPKLQTWQQWGKSARELCLRMVKGWKGFTENGKPLECTNETKPRLIDKVIRITGPDGEETRKPLWRLINEALEKQDEDEKGN